MNSSPMLAVEYKNRKHNLNYPLFIQPKIDGVRSLYYDNNLWSRNNNIFYNFDNVKKECEKLVNLLSSSEKILFLDGELYNSDLDFQDIVSIVKTKQELDIVKRDKAKNIKYYIFDFCSKGMVFEKRFLLLKKLFTENKFEHLALVDSIKVSSFEEVEEHYKEYIIQKYEGVMFRNNTKYENKRSKNLQKLKPQDNDEFEIISFKQGTGKEENCVVWTLKTKEGKSFNSRPIGNYENRKKYFEYGKDYIGKMATIRYQGFSQEGIPRFPVFVSFRDYE